MNETNEWAAPGYTGSFLPSCFAIGATIRTHLEVKGLNLSAIIIIIIMIS